MIAFRTHPDLYLSIALMLSIMTVEYRVSGWRFQQAVNLGFELSIESIGLFIVGSEMLCIVTSVTACQSGHFPYTTAHKVSLVTNIAIDESIQFSLVSPEFPQ